MEKIFSWLKTNSIYIIVSIICTIVLGLIFFNTTQDLPMINSAACGLFGSFFLGILFETYNFFKDELFKFKNCLYWLIGGIIGLIILILI